MQNTLLSVDLVAIQIWEFNELCMQNAERNAVSLSFATHLFVLFSWKNIFYCGAETNRL